MKKRILTWLLAINMLGSLLTVPAGAAAVTKFSDVSDSYTATAVESLRLMGVLDGYGDGTFRPDTVLNRAQFCKMAVYAMNGSNELGRYRTVTVFSDVKLDDFKAEDVDQKAAKQAISDLGVNATIDEVCTVGDTGYVITTTDKDGFGGNIQITVGIMADGTVNGISFLSISETAGLGMKAKEADFKDQFKDKNVEKFTYTKTGESGDDMIDAISGATITTNAVTNAVDSALVYFQNELGGGSNE